MRRALVASATAGLLALTPAAATADSDHAFSDSFESGQLQWRLVEYTSGATTATTTTGDAADGTRFVRLVSGQSNHARLVLTVPVAMNTTYRFAAAIRATGGDGALPAVLGVDGTAATTPDVPTGAGWQQRELYIRTAGNAVLPLTIGLGFFGRTVAGAADFDAVTLDRVDTIPAGAPQFVMSPPEAKPDRAVDVAFKHHPSKAMWPLLGILVALGVGTGGYLVRGRGPA